MNTSLQNMNYFDGKKGKFAISAYVNSSDVLEDWIKEKKFYDFTIDSYRMDRHTRKRNKLYSFNHPEIGKQVILKVSKIDSQYTFLRRVNLLISTFFHDYNLRAFKGAQLLKNIGVNCPTPIAYWTESSLFTSNKNYYLYEKVESNFTLFSFCENIIDRSPSLNKNLYGKLAIKITDIIRSIHTAGYRQGDPHPGNFLISLEKSNQDDLSAEDILISEIYIIDLDKFNTAKPLGKIIKRFFDIRCLRRCTLGPFNQEDMLKFYLKDEYSQRWRLILYFWIKGGFNPFKWFKKPKRGR